MTPVETRIHTRLLRFTLGEEESALYWRAHAEGRQLTPASAFADYTFGQKSEAYVERALRNLRIRFDALPPSIDALPLLELTRAERVVVCHVHTLLTDPFYRCFSIWLTERRELGIRAMHKDEVTRWVETEQPERWAPSTRIQWATKLLATSREAGLVTGSKDPRPLAVPHVTDTVLTYVLHLLRTVQMEHTLLVNPYLRSLGLDGGLLTDRVRNLPAVSLERMGDLVDLRFHHPDLLTWARSRS